MTLMFALNNMYIDIKRDLRTKVFNELNSILFAQEKILLKTQIYHLLSYFETTNKQK